MMKVGDVRILVTYRTAFTDTPEFTKVTITEVHDDSAGVGGAEDKLHRGYTAESDEGHVYTCQYPTFDEWSTDPYSNWQRENFVPGVDDPDNFLLWDAVRIARDEMGVKLLNQFPELVGLCREPRSFHGGIHGPYYTADGCSLCRWLAEDQ